MAVETQQAPQLTHDVEPIHRDRLFIGGEWVEPAGDGRIDVIDSTTEQVMGSVPEGTPADVDRAVQAARGAFEALGCHARGASARALCARSRRRSPRAARRSPR